MLLVVVTFVLEETALNVFAILSLVVFRALRLLTDAADRVLSRNDVIALMAVVRELFDSGGNAVLESFETAVSGPRTPLVGLLTAETALL